MVKRNKGIDIVRAMAILVVIIYHFYVLVGGDRYIALPIVHNMIMVGGEIGVTLFFIISGYGIFLSIDGQERKGAFSKKVYFQKRCLRILPHYYLSLLIIIFIGTQGAVLSNARLFDIFTHGFLIHNFFPSTCGSINTVLWTMGVIFQFYFVAIFLYKYIKRRPVLSLALSVAFTIVCKIIIFHFIFTKISIKPIYYFIYARQLFTAIDNFVVGMFIANFNGKSQVKIWKKLACIVIGGVVSIIWCVMPAAYNRYSDSWMGYIWHTILALLLGVLVWFVSILEFKKDSLFLEVTMFISKYQYGIYLWHFVVASNLLQSSSWIIRVANKSFVLVAIVLSVICILVGYIASITLETPDYRKIFGNNKAFRRN